MDKLGGAKRKNGHKSNCTCHICENMMKKAKRGGYEEDAEKEMLKKMGGSKKKNGHKPDCMCPICKNMRNAKKTMKKGGADEEEKPYDNEEEKNDLAITGGKTRKRGRGSNNHKLGCKCPICKNMKKKGKKGGEEPDLENQIGDLEEGGIKAQKISKTTTYADNEEKVEAKEVKASDDEYEEIDEMDLAEKGEAGPGAKVGGRKSKKRRGNGHKANCMCPICKNMRKGRKTRRR
jgi:hypothetical protein